MNVTNTKEALERAGTGLLLHAKMSWPECPQNNTASHTAKVRKLLAKVRADLELADPKDDPYRYAAAKEALELFEACERVETSHYNLGLFDAYVEAIHGGARTIDFGGLHIANKPSAREAYLRAAAVALWLKFPQNRDQLAADAKKILGIKDRNALRKLVENFHERHEHDLKKARSPLSIHYDRVCELIDNKGLHRLTDFT